MNKKLLACVIVCVSLTIALSGCTEEQSKKKKDTVDALLNVLGLSLEDLSGKYNISNEEYITESYMLESGPFKGITLAESYNTQFFNSSTNFLNQVILKYDTKEICKTALDTAKWNLRYDFTEISPTIEIGDDSFFGNTTYKYYEHLIPVYVLCFRVANVIVFLNGMAPQQGTFLDYGTIIESTINEHLD